MKYMHADYTSMPFPVIEATEAQIKETEEIEILKSIVPSFTELDVLEIGSGTGRLSIKFINKSLSYLGVEKSASMLLSCFNRLANFHLKESFDHYFIHGDFFDINFGKKRFDIVVLTDFVVCYQKSYKKMGQLLNQVNHLIKENGIVLIDIPIVKKRKKRDTSSKEVKYNCNYSISQLEITRKYKIIDFECIRFSYEANVKSISGIFTKYNWELDFFYPNKYKFEQVINNIFKGSQIRITEYDNGSLESIFYSIQLKSR